MTKTPSQPDILRINGDTRPVVWASGTRYIAGDTEARTIYTPTAPSDPHLYIAGTLRAVHALTYILTLAIGLAIGILIATPKG